MASPDDLTLPEDRPISEHEAAVVEWLLANASLEGPLDHLRDGVRHLRVVARCGCGCPSVDFIVDGQSRGAHPIADAVARDSRGRVCGVIVWGLDGRVSGLEICEMDRDGTTELPNVESLRRWESFVP